MRYTSLRLLALALCAPAFLLADNIALGTDYLSIQSGTFIDLPTFGRVNLQGVPIGPGGSSVIVERLTDAPINGAPAPVKVVGLSLTNITPVPGPLGGFFDIFFTLDPAKLALDIGTIDIDGSLAGGTFTSNMTVYMHGHAVKVGDPLVTQDFFQQAILVNAGATWSPTPAAGDTIVPGVDDGGPTDQPANLHSGLDDDEVDFFATGPYQFSFTGGGGGSGAATVSTASIPEPATLLLFGAAAFLGRLRLRSRR